MTSLLYQTDGYIQEFEATLIAVNEAERSVLLDQTAFYPGGGGQPCDMGAITCDNTKYMVERVKKQGEDAIHFISGSEKLPGIGMRIHGRIDWDRRYKLMRTHSAMHVLCGVVFRDYGAQVTGGEMEPLKGRMDFEFASMRGELVKEIETHVNEEIAMGRDINVRILPRDEAFRIPDLIRTKINLLPAGISQVRTVEIQGLDLQADGGTHVKNTSEIGSIRVVDYKSKGAINKRIYLELQ